MRDYNRANATILSKERAAELGLSPRAKWVRPCAKCTEQGEILEEYPTLKQACEKNHISAAGNLSTLLKANDGLPHYMAGYYWKTI